ncbi:MAG: c-type cytochrome [Pseudomonadota bacterium]
MLDTMTMTKATGALCGSLLVFLLGNWAAEEIYSMEKGHHGDDHGPAYVIDIGQPEEDAGETEEGPAFAELYAAADIGSGERVFGKCKACHKVENGANGAGPHLFELVGRAVEAADGFGYSGALSSATDTWTPEALNAFLESPSGYAPGTSMSFKGLPKPKDRANVIAYLDSLDGSMTEVEAPADDGASLGSEANGTDFAAAQ